MFYYSPTTIMQWSTADICDWCGDSVEYVDPLFHSYGMKKQFCGKIRTVKCFEDNSMVKKLLGTPTKGEVSLNTPHQHNTLLGPGH